MRQVLPALCFAILPAVLSAESATPSLGYAGAKSAAPSDHNGQDCSTCHNSFGPANSDSNGSLKVIVSDYLPGIEQTIRIIIQHPQATHWGFQMTIRQVSDETQSAGIFSTAVTNVPAVQIVCDDGSRLGGIPPCNDLRQFAEHKLDPGGSAGAPEEFDVSWTAPGTEVGKLHVYVAAVAADGNGDRTGDRVYTSVQTISNAGSCSVISKAALRTTVNAGSFQQGFSSNSLVSVLGLGFEVGGYQRTAGRGDFVNNGFPTQLGCVSVQVTGPGISQPTFIPLTFVRTDQINAQMPVFSGTGPVTLQVILNPGQGNVITSDLDTYDTLQPFAPSFFLFANSTSIAAQFGGTASVVANPSVVVGARPAKPGDIVTLYGTGFGDTIPSVGTGQLATAAASLVNGITVKIGNNTLSPSDVLYAGLSPGSISGLYQFNVRIPPATPNGDVQVTISIGSVQTQSPATIPITGSSVP